MSSPLNFKEILSLLRQFIIQEKAKGNTFFYSHSEICSLAFKKLDNPSSRTPKASPLLSSGKNSAVRAEDKSPPPSAELITAAKGDTKIEVFDQSKASAVSTHPFSLEPLPAHSDLKDFEAMRTFFSQGDLALCKNKPSIVIGAFEAGDALDFLKKVAAAIDREIAPTQLVVISTEADCEKLFHNKSIKLLLISQAKLTSLGFIKTLYQGRPAIHEVDSLKGPIPLLPLADFSAYSQDLNLKRALWNILKRIFQKISNE